MAGVAPIAHIFVGRYSMNYLAKEQTSWGSHNALSLDASIAMSAVAALGALIVADGDPATTMAFPLAGAVVVSIAVMLLRAKRQKHAKIESSE